MSLPSIMNEEEFPPLPVRIPDAEPFYLVPVDRSIRPPAPVPVPPGGAILPPYTEEDRKLAARHEEDLKLAESVRERFPGIDGTSLLVYYLRTSQYDIETAARRWRKDLNRRKLAKHFDMCLLRFGGLHSYYKINRELQIVVIPVLGREQEHHKNRPPGQWVKDDEVSWHFYAHDQAEDTQELEWPNADTNPLRAFVRGDLAKAPHGRNICFDGNWEPGTTLHTITEKLVFAKSFAPFAPFHRDCTSVYARICSFLADKDLNELLPRYKPDPLAPYRLN